MMKLTVSHKLVTYMDYSWETLPKSEKVNTDLDTVLDWAEHVE